MSKHTQNPWYWVEGTDAIDVDWNGRSWTIATVGNCRLGWHEDKNCESREAGANAKLIASAPDLLQAAKLVLAWYEAENDHSKVPDFYERMAMCKASEDAIRAAIAKAEGGAA